MALQRDPCGIIYAFVAKPFSQLEEDENRPILLLFWMPRFDHILSCELSCHVVPLDIKDVGEKVGFSGKSCYLTSWFAHFCQGSWNNTFTSNRLIVYRVDFGNPVMLGTDAFLLFEAYLYSLMQITEAWKTKRNKASEEIFRNRRPRYRIWERWNKVFRPDSYQHQVSLGSEPCVAWVQLLASSQQDPSRTHPSPRDSLFRIWEQTE